jgi:hypothetical protein
LVLAVLCVTVRKDCRAVFICPDVGLLFLLLWVLVRFSWGAGVFVDQTVLNELLWNALRSVMVHQTLRIWTPYCERMRLHTKFMFFGRNDRWPSAGTTCGWRARGRVTWQG